MGSKNRIAKYILPIMLKHRKEGQYWVEPFVGGANMIDKVEGNRIGADSNEHCIEALRTIRDSIEFIPKNKDEFSESNYHNLKTSDFKYKSFAYFAYSYSGKFKRGWRRDKEGKRDYVAESYRNALKQHPKLQGVKLENLTYKELFLPTNSLIYCDPPYEGTTKYKDSFNSYEFWQ